MWPHRCCSPAQACTGVQGNKPHKAGLFFSPWFFQQQLPKMTRDRVGETAWHSAKLGAGGVRTIPPLKRPHGSSSSALVSLGKAQLTFPSILQTAPKLLDTTCLPCPEQDQDFPSKTLQQQGFLPVIISDQRAAHKVWESLLQQHNPRTHTPNRRICS